MSKFFYYSIITIFVFLFLEVYVYSQKIYISKDSYNFFEPVELVIESTQPLDIANQQFLNLKDLDYIGNSQNYSKNQQKNLYFYYFLFKAKKLGTIYIEPFQIAIPKSKNKIHFKGKKIQILDSDNFAKLQNSNQNREIWKLNPNDVILEILFNKNQVYVGEQIQQTVCLFIKDNLIDKIYFEPQSVQNFLQNIKNTQFWEENIDTLPYQNITFEYKNGMRYQKYILNLSYLYAFSPGSIHYEPLPLKIKKKKYWTNEPIENPLEDLIVYSNPLDLNIIQAPIPNLLTGKFYIQYKKLPQSIKLGDKIVYQLTIQGNGNLNTITNYKPKLNKPCEIFEVNHSVKQSLHQNELLYILNLEYYILPNDTGNFILYETKIPYYNTVDHKKDFLIVPKHHFYVENTDIKQVDNQITNEYYHSSQTFSGWNIWGIASLLSISFVFLWFLYKELVK